MAEAMEPPTPEEEDALASLARKHRQCRRRWALYCATVWSTHVTSLLVTLSCGALEWLSAQLWLFGFRCFLMRLKRRHDGFQRLRHSDVINYNYDMNPDETIPPKAGISDVAHTVVKTGLSAIPMVGGPAAELFAALIVLPLSRRRDKWVQSIADGLKALEEKIQDFALESVQNNEAFATTAMYATQVALRNHHEEKLEALRNAVLNVASGNAPDDDLQLIFLNLIDSLTPWHLRMLCFFQDPIAYGKARGINHSDLYTGSISQTLEQTFPELRGQRAFYDQIAKDLFARGRIGIESLHTMMTASGVLSKRSTEMGDRFVAFITSPV